MTKHQKWIAVFLVTSALALGGWMADSNVRYGNITATGTVKIGGGSALATSNQSGTGSLCMTVSCVMTTPNIGAATDTSLTQPASTIQTFFDNQGGVRWQIPANGTGQTVINNANLLAGTTLGGLAAATPSVPYNRFSATRGTTLTTAKVGTLTGWGSTASVSSVFGSDSFGIVNIASSGTGQTANPTFVITFSDGTWGTNGPMVIVCRGDANAPSAAAFFNSSTSTTATLGLQGTPAAGNTYGFLYIAVGR